MPILKKKCRAGALFYEHARRIRQIKSFPFQSGSGSVSFSPAADVMMTSQTANVNFSNCGLIYCFFMLSPPYFNSEDTAAFAGSSVL